MPSIKPVDSDDGSDDTSAYYSASDGCSEHSSDAKSSADNANDDKSSISDEDNGETSHSPADEQATTASSTAGAGESRSTSCVQEAGRMVENAEAKDDFVGTCTTVAAVDKTSPKSCVLPATSVIAADTGTGAGTNASAGKNEHHRLPTPPPEDPTRPTTTPNEENGDESKSATPVAPPEFSATKGAAGQQQSQGVESLCRHQVSEYQSATVSRLNPGEEDVGTGGGQYAFFAAITVSALKTEVSKHAIHAASASKVGAHGGRNIGCTVHYIRYSVGVS